MSFRVFEDRIFVIPEEENDTTKAGIILPGESGKEPMRFATVAVVGEGHYSDQTGMLVPIAIEVGDRVFYSRGSGSKITIEDVEYVCLQAREVVGVIEPSFADEDVDDTTSPFSLTDADKIGPLPAAVTE